MWGSWTQEDARQEFRRRARTLADAIKRAQDMRGDPVASFVCLLAQEPDQGCSRLQVWTREGLPDELRARVEETVPDDGGSGRLPVVLWALDGSIWVMWSRVFLASPGGTA